MTNSPEVTRTLRQKEELRMSEMQNQFEGFRGSLWLAVGFLLLAAALGSAVYIVAHFIALL